MKIIVTGSKGQLGSEIRYLSESRTADAFVFVDVDELDITNLADVEAFIENERPDVCINCAAYTAVDKAESEEFLAYKVNAEGPENLAQSCSSNDVLLLHISTDFVFDGSASTPYKPGDPVQATGVYGASKAEGEARVLLLGKRFYIIRTSWVYSSYGNNFVKTMVRIGKERESLNVVSDQRGRPTYARDLARALFAFIDAEKEIPYGLYHYSNTGEATWYELADEVMKAYGLPCKVLPISTSDYPTPAKRPAYSVMDLQETQNFNLIPFHDWKESLYKCISILNQNEHA